MAGISERERIVRLETRAKELETVLQQLGSYIDLILKTGGLLCCDTVIH